MRVRNRAGSHRRGALASRIPAFGEVLTLVQSPKFEVLFAVLIEANVATAW